MEARHAPGFHGLGRQFGRAHPADCDFRLVTNFRVSGKEDAIKITPPILLTLEYGVEFIEDDELVEITPKSIRLRKRFLKEHERKRASREA